MYVLGYNAGYGRCPIQLQGDLRALQLEIRDSRASFHVPDRSRGKGSTTSGITVCVVIVQPA